jgi:hypothetical protein
MTIDQKIKYAEYFREVWVMLTDIPSPIPRQFMLWLSSYPPDIVEEGISIAANKVLVASQQGRNMTQDEMLRYASGVMRNKFYQSQGVS